MKKKNESQEVGGLLPFDLIVLVQDVAKRWLVVVLAALVVGVGAYIKADVDYAPVYQANTIFVVTARGSSTSVYNNLSSTSSVAELFTSLLNSSLMKRTIAKEMGTGSVNGSISTAVIPNTNLINMTVKSSNARDAFLISRALIEHHESLTYEMVGDVALEVLQSPAVPVAPNNRSEAKEQMKTMAFYAAIAALAVLAVMSYLRDNVRSENEVLKKLDCDFLVEIPHERKYKTLLSGILRRKTSILITNPVTGFRFVETVRKLRRRVEQLMGKGKVLMVTSLMENEGKSTVAVNLALDMAQKHEKVLLIDCDLRKPACHAVLDQRKFSAGVQDVLLGRAELADALLYNEETNLHMLLAKTDSRKAGDLAGSRQMDALLRWAREQFDVVIVDTPPMNAASDAESMTRLVDNCLLVVRQNVAPATALNRAIAALEGGRAKLLGCVLNNTYSSVLSSGTGYGYGYGYGSGYGKYGKYGHYGHYGHYASERSGK